MQERPERRKSRDQDFASPGPVITISRDYGCPGRRIARRVAETFTEKNLRHGHLKEWRWISKEIIEESARELKLSTPLMKELAEYKQKGFFENLALFFSDEFYPGDAKIKNSIAKFIYTAAAEGNVVIVGRASEAITKNFEKSFHVKLLAPLDWRVEVIANSCGMTLQEAKKELNEMDRRRKLFRNYFERDREDVEYFDAFYNCATMTDEEIVESILIVAETRGFVA